MKMVIFWSVGTLCYETMGVSIVHTAPPETQVKNVLRASP